MFAYKLPCLKNKRFEFNPLVHQRNKDIFLPIVRFEDDPNAKGGGNNGGDGDSSTIKEMRVNLEKANEEAKDSKTKLEAANQELTLLKREKMNEVERLKDEIKELATSKNELVTQLNELAPLKETVKKQQDFLTGLFETELTKVPEGNREKVKAITFMEGDPIGSFAKLTDVLALVIPQANTDQKNGQGNITNPGSTGAGTGNNTQNAKIDPKTVTWGDAIQSMDKRLAQQRGQGS